MNKKIFRSLSVLMILCCTAYSSFAQLVLDGAYITVSGSSSSNSVYLVVDQSSTSGITRLGSGGHIYTPEQYGFIKWNAGTGTGNYVFPFGISGTAADYIPLTFNKTTSGSSGIVASTWRTNAQNVLHPGVSNVAACHVMTGYGDSLTTAVDRFWDIRTTAATTADITFSYHSLENSTIATPTAQITAQRWNGTSWEVPVGPGNTGVTSGIGTVGPVTGQTVFTPFVLVDRSLPMMRSSFAIPKKKLDAGYYSTIGNYLYFEYDGEYTANTLQYKVYDSSRALVTGATLSSSTRNFGDNRYSLNCTSIASGYYTLEITSDKKEIVKLRFKKP